jgi:hypothetical protein
MIFREIIDLIKVRHSCNTDYMAIKLLGLNKGTVYKALKNNSIPDDTVIYRCEKLLDYPEGSLLLDMHSKRTKCPEAAEILKKLSGKIIAGGLSVFCLITVSYSLIDNGAVASYKKNNVDNNIHYAELIKSVINTMKRRIFDIRLIFIDFNKKECFLTI